MKRITFNWDDLPELDAPRRRQVQATADDKIKLAHAKAKRSKTTKNHSTNKERSFIERKHAKEVTESRNNRDEAHRQFKQEVRAYYRGERADYPKRS